MMLSVIIIVDVIPQTAAAAVPAAAWRKINRCSFERVVVVVFVAKMTIKLHSYNALAFLQRSSIACYAERCTGYLRHVCPSVRLSVTLWY